MLRYAIKTKSRTIRLPVSQPASAGRARLRGVTGAIAPGPLLQGGPRDDIYLF